MSEALAAKLAELSARFRELAADECQAIEAALAAGDRSVLAERAHKLAGNAGMFGEAALGGVALQLEAAAETGADVVGPARRLLALLKAL